ncbi:MAG: hypothetical protein LAP21_06930 [Acidobacteriia bacterium]|nr:hypothetical protein [Terriglobia bacterium]
MSRFLPAIVFLSLSFSAHAQKFDVAPVPADSHELVTGPAQVPATPAERASALNLLERARQNGDMHIAGSAPFILKAQFTATGNVQFTGQGEVTETWLNGRHWRWTASLGNYSQVRTSANGHIFDEQPVSVVPMRVQMLRAAIFNPVHAVPAGTGIRTATVQSNGMQVTCLLSTERGQLPGGHSRSWGEREYCVQNDSGLLHVYSEAPGVYVEYGYSQRLQFHGRTIPDQVSVFIAGSPVIEAQISISDVGSNGEALEAARPSTNEPPIMLGQASRFPIAAQERTGLKEIQPVIVHVTVDNHGNLLEEELVTAADPALARMALQIVKDSKFSPIDSTQREAYINVRFSPAAQ